MPRTYDVRTHGCQMNVHDSERLAGLLETAGYVDLASVPQDARPEVADVVVFNTCAVRENADNMLYGNLGMLRQAKLSNPEMQIAVGGCMAQKDRGTIVERAPWVDVVFGTHNIGSLPALLDRAAHNKRAEVEILESLETFPSTLPTRRDSAYSGWVSISVGCNNTCTFCIVPSLRAGSRTDARARSSPRSRLSSRRVVEITLLGQNVNTYGVEFGDRLAFGKLLRACGEVDELERVRFTSLHPALPSRTMSSSRWPRRRTSCRACTCRSSRAPTRCSRTCAAPTAAPSSSALDTVRDHIPRRDHDRHHRRPWRDRGGLPGHARRRARGPLLERLHVPVLHPPRHARGDDARPGAQGGRPGAVRPAHRPPGGGRLGGEPASEGQPVEVLVAPAEGRKDAATHRLSGRARDNRLVHFAVPEGAAVPRPGDWSRSG